MIKHSLLLSAALAGLVVTGGATLAGGAAAGDANLGPMAPLMANRVGDWNVDITFTPSPGARPSHTVATQSSRLLGGRWLVSELHGAMGGRPFNGLGINGYDQKSGKYVGIWIDSAADAILPVEGRYDAESRRFTTVSDEATPGGLVHVMSVTTPIGADTEETTLTAPGPDGKPFTRMTMRLTRVK